ncbi:selenoneine synthase SenA [Massilia glaciei]|uniref:selenoneine synthase SenA n=1 Tax=Massilia glaciei TaxID=1524097 RepID=UPI0015E810B1|nr:selenoneine synthase SenA [Massilia glaciei]
MHPTTPSFRHASPAELAAALQDARNYTLRLFDLCAAAGYDELSRVPHIATINPPLWELGHIAWFAEWFILREAASSHPAAAQRDSLLTQGDDWFDSGTVPHRSRWTLELPRAGALKTYCHEVLDRTLDKLARADGGDTALYPYRLALAHEDMHGEALLYTLQTLGVGVPEGLLHAPALHVPGAQLSYPGGRIVLGGGTGAGFAFDNEKNGAPHQVAAFQIDANLVSNAQFAEFVADGGYQDGRHWSANGRAWLMLQERSAPRYWQRAGSQWRGERFGRLCTLAGAEPVRHVNLYEAQAYCAWLGRRLPSEAEWQFAARSGQGGFNWGQLWEWTASPFEPYPGADFTPDAYREYSAPWFGTHQVLRGASFATPARMLSPHFRNFYLPDRDDMFVGLRTCAA